MVEQWAHPGHRGREPGEWGGLVVEPPEDESLAAVRYAVASLELPRVGWLLVTLLIVASVALLAWGVLGHALVIPEMLLD